MPGSEIKGRSAIATYPNSNKAYKKGGRIKAAHGTLRGRENLLDERRRIRGELKGGGIAKRGLGKAFKGGGLA